MRVLKPLIVFAALCTPAMAQDLAHAPAQTPLRQNNVPYQYPVRAIESGVEAICLVTFEIDEAGGTQNLCTACDARYQDSSSSLGRGWRERFETVSEGVVEQWRFTPDTSGRRYRTEFTFALSSPVVLPNTPLEDTCGDGVRMN